MCDSKRKTAKEQTAFTQNLFNVYCLCGFLIHSQLMEVGLSKSYGQERWRADIKKQEMSVFVQFYSSVLLFWSILFIVWWCKIVNAQPSHNQIIISFQVQSGVLNLPTSHIKTMIWSSLKWLKTVRPKKLSNASKLNVFLQFFDNFQSSSFSVLAKKAANKISNLTLFDWKIHLMQHIQTVLD